MVRSQSRPSQIDRILREGLDRSLRSNRQVTYAGEELRVDTLAERIDTIERDIDDDSY